MNKQFRSAISLKQHERMGDMVTYTGYPVMMKIEIPIEAEAQAWVDMVRSVCICGGEGNSFIQ